MIFSFPNILTYLRLAALPLLAAVFWLPTEQAVADWAATVVFLSAALTDFLDGHLARKINQESKLGAFLDPVADKMLIIVALLLLIDAGRAPVLASMLIIGREVFVSALREWAALAGKSAAVRVSAAGKWKTATQMTAVALLFFGGNLGSMATVAVGEWVLWAAAVLSLWSLAVYCYNFGRAAE